MYKHFVHILLLYLGCLSLFLLIRIFASDSELDEELMLESEVSELEVANVVTPAKAAIQIDYDVYFDDEFDHDSSPRSVKETNEDKVDYDSDCSHNNDSEE